MSLGQHRARVARPLSPTQPAYFSPPVFCNTSSSSRWAGRSLQDDIVAVDHDRHAPERTRVGRCIARIDGVIGDLQHGIFSLVKGLSHWLTTSPVVRFL